MTIKHVICVFGLLPLLLLAACDGNPCTNFTCNNGGTCTYDETPKCSDNEALYREQYLECWRPSKYDCVGIDRKICIAGCIPAAKCTGRLNINSDGVAYVTGAYVSEPYCICPEGFTGTTCSGGPDASDADDIDDTTDIAVADQAEVADANVGDEAGATDTNIGDESAPTDANVGDEAGATDVPSPDVPLVPGWMDACNAWNAAIAERLVACQKANPDYLAGRPGALDCTTIGADIDAGKTEFDATKANACTAYLQALPCLGLVSTTSTGPLDFPIPGSDCENVLVGTGVSSNGPTPGTECQRSTQCASGYCSNRNLPGQCPGACEDRSAEGTECAYTQKCAAGLTCASGTCKTPGTVGSYCYVDERCAADLRCINGSCQAMLASGASCTYDLQCEPEYRCFGGTCQPLVGLNGACTEAATPSLPTVCGQGYWCNSGTCTAYPTVGQSCADSVGCTGGYCDNEAVEPTCTAFLDIGANCTSKTQCESQVASSGVCAPYGDYYCGTMW